MHEARHGVAESGAGNAWVDTPGSAALRARFPLLARTVGGRPLVYLDTAATAHKPDAVIQAQEAFYRVSNANIHRGLHTLGDEATTLFEACRARVAAWLGVGRPESVVITHGATNALNLLARGLEPRLKEGDEVLLTEMEHHANLVPWLMLAKRRGVVIRHIPITDGGVLDLSAAEALVGPRTRVLAFVHVSNVLGTVNPVAELVALARRVGALTVLDAAQSVGHMPFDFAALDVDFAVFSAHKVYGPMGLGFLLGRPDALARLEPMEGGGEMIGLVHLDRVTWADIPHRFEAGTPNVAGAAAFPPAIELLESIGLAAVVDHERALVGHALEGLREFDDLVVYGPTDPAKRGGVVSFYDPLVHPHDLATVLDTQGVAVRAGHHCAQPLHRRLGVPATARASFGVYSTMEEVDALVAGIHEARMLFAG